MTQENPLPGKDKKGLLARRRLRRSQTPVSHDVATTDPTPPSDLERHRAEIASRVLSLFDHVDARVATMIGFTGNIRTEIFHRKPQHRNDGIDKTGMDPHLAKYVQGSSFFFRQDNEQSGPGTMYTLECYNGNFGPSIYQQTQDGFIEFSVVTGQSGDEYDSVLIRRRYDRDSDRFDRTIKTFIPNQTDHYAPNHPLAIKLDMGPQMIYDNIDPDGNVTLLDQQWTPWGKYSAADHSFSRDDGYRRQGRVEGNMLQIDSLQFSIKTNIYEELRAITSDLPGLPQ